MDSIYNNISYMLFDKLSLSNKRPVEKLMVSEGFYSPKNKKSFETNKSFISPLKICHFRQIPLTELKTKTSSQLDSVYLEYKNLKLHENIKKALYKKISIISKSKVTSENLKKVILRVVSRSSSYDAIIT